MAVLLLAGCDDDPNTPGIQIICPTPAPQLAGTWTGSLQDRQLSITLTEGCLPHLFGARYWDIGGQWTWSGQQGNAAALTHAGGVDLYLRMGTPPQPTSFVTLHLVTPVPVTGSGMEGFARGAWRLPTDTTTLVASIDSAGVVLQRR